MSDEINDNVPAEIPAEELVIKVGNEPEDDDKPEVVTMTPAEYAALKAQSDSAAAIAKGIEGLGAKLSTPQAPAPMPVNAPVQTPEEFFTEHADDLFDKEKGAKVLGEYVKRVGEREYGGMFSAVSSQLAATKKELLAAKDPQYKKYESEIEALVNAQPPAVRIQPDIYERAWREIRSKHQSEIEEEAITERVNAAVEAKLKELGIDAKGASTTRPAAYVNSEGRSSPTASGSTKRTVRLPDEATRQKLEREAKRRGLNIDDLLRTKGY